MAPWCFRSLALLAATVVIGLIAGRLLAGARAEDAGRVLWRGLLLGLLVARLAFVWQYRDHFLQNPLKILDLRDGGWASPAGLAAALLYGAYAVLRDRARAAPCWSRWRWARRSGSAAAACWRHRRSRSHSWRPCRCNSSMARPPPWPPSTASRWW
ncbi:prolipoprotein diacylglyceryl transferase family protein [Achromobacter insuavis]